MKTNTIIRQTALSTALLLTGLISAQEPKSFGKARENQCSATQYENYLKTAKGKRTTDAQFENWLAPKIEEIRKRNNTQKSGNTVVTLPVVVHVIHNGDAIGVDENIADEQVFSQITVLNNDFRRLLNTPGYVEGNTGTDIEIEFCLAQQDPNGNPTNGVDRVYRNKASWGMMAIETQLKPSTQWDPERYINIWVCKFGGDLVFSDGEVGGYAFFPEGSGLEGLEGAESYAENDGVTMNYKCFGSSDYYPEGSYLLPGADKGRATVHEMGHFFGLRHIWGDGSDCTATDYCEDTPTAITMNTSCEPVDSCPENDGFDMIENYMDYTPDECKSVFTQNQKDRMLATLQNALRRGTLITSNACQAPTAGIGDNQLQELNIYPNPAREVLNITSDVTGVAGSYEIYNILGQAITARNITFDDNQSVDVSGLSQGVYVIKLTREGKTKTLKFIKE
jgi:hypothetical protein